MPQDKKGKQEFVYTKEQMDSIAKCVNAITVTGRQSLLLASVIQTLEQCEVRIVEINNTEDGDE